MNPSKSQLFSEYNRERAEAKSAGRDTGRLNRALGLAQKTAPRPYVTTLTSCTCPDHLYRGVVCKHMLALRLRGEAAPAPEPAPAPLTREEKLRRLGF
jgi:hypothetical protein